MSFDNDQEKEDECWQELKIWEQENEIDHLDSEQKDAWCDGYNRCKEFLSQRIEKFLEPKISALQEENQNLKGDIRVLQTLMDEKDSIRNDMLVSIQLLGKIVEGIRDENISSRKEVAYLKNKNINYQV